MTIACNSSSLQLVCISLFKICKTLKMFVTKNMFLLHVFIDCVCNCCAALQEVSFRLSVAVMIFLVAACDSGLFTSAAFSFL